MGAGESTAGGSAVLAEGTRASGKTWRLRIECALLFGGLPSLLFLVRHDLRGLVIPIILVAALGFLIYLLRDKTFPHYRLLNAECFLRGFLPTLKVLVLLGVPITAFSWWYAPERFLGFPQNAPRFWLMLMVLYPLLSAYPQELIYRTFFYQRYRQLFSNDRQWMLASAIAFGWAHAFLGNWIAPLFTFFGGLLFANTYLRTKSLLQVAIEHGLWGNLLFTVGIGWYFYAGSIS